MGYVVYKGIANAACVPVGQTMLAMPAYTAGSAMRVVNLGRVLGLRILGRRACDAALMVWRPS